MIPAKINIGITDDHTLFRMALTDYLSRQQQLNIVIQTSSYEELILHLKDKRIDVLLLDIYMQTLNGDEALKIIREQYPDIKVIVLSMCIDMNILNEMLNIGVHGLISKADEPEKLLEAIAWVAGERIFRNKLFTEVLYWSKQYDIESAKKTKVNLNDREKEIILMIWEEKSNKEISEHLFIGVRSIEKIRQDIKEKLGVKTTVAVLKYALKEGIIKPSWKYSLNNNNLFAGRHA